MCLLLQLLYLHNINSPENIDCWWNNKWVVCIKIYIILCFGRTRMLVIFAGFEIKACNVDRRKSQSKNHTPPMALPYLLLISVLFPCVNQPHLLKMMGQKDISLSQFCTSVIISKQITVNLQNMCVSENLFYSAFQLFS